jgi:bifunctional NMN adenylyltransferase/nudix hydrolase
MKCGIFIGRFQPCHEGHIHALSVAASQVDTLLVLVGSANRTRSISNPWTYHERVQMLRKKLRAAKVENVEFCALNDYKYNDEQWASDVRFTVRNRFAFTPTLFGHQKEGNNYLKWFPEWEFRNIESSYTINATQVRTKMFNTRDKEMPQAAQADWDYYQGEAARFANYPFPETLNFNCSDAVLVCQGKVLLIKRKFAPGLGSWALPGGFRNANETFLECAIRELIEETNVRVPEKVLRGSIVKTELFDEPKRSQGIPRNTLAVLIKIQPDADGKCPRANGQDDALETEWVPIIDALNNYQLYDDHADIISKLTGTTAYPAALSI